MVLLHESHGWRGCSLSWALCSLTCDHWRARTSWRGQLSCWNTIYRPRTFESAGRPTSFMCFVELSDKTWGRRQRGRPLLRFQSPLETKGIRRGVIMFVLPSQEAETRYCTQPMVFVRGDFFLIETKSRGLALPNTT